MVRFRNKHGIAALIQSSGSVGAKLHRREGNNLDELARSLIDVLFSINLLKSEPFCQYAYNQQSAKNHVTVYRIPRL